MRATGDLDVWTIEATSLTWAAIERPLARGARRWGFSVRVVGRLESFCALVEMARVGFEHALVPAGTAVAMGTGARELLRLPGVARPVVAIGRTMSLQRSVLAPWIEAVRAAWRSR